MHAKRGRMSAAKLDRLVVGAPAVVTLLGPGVLLIVPLERLVMVSVVLLSDGEGIGDVSVGSASLEVSGIDDSGVGVPGVDVSSSEVGVAVVDGGGGGGVGVEIGLGSPLVFGAA